MTFGKCFHGCVPDWTIAGAATKIPAKLVIELLLAPNIMAVVALEHRNNESRRAITALRAMPLDHGSLHRMQTTGFSLDGVPGTLPLGLPVLRSVFDGG